MFPQPADAITTMPLRLEYYADPGDTIQDVVKVLNEQDTELLVNLAIDNVTAGEGEQGYPEFVGEDHPSGITQWMTVDTGRHTVKPRGQYAFPLLIEIPEDAEPGGHYGAVCIGEVVSEDFEGVTGVTGEVCTLILIYVSGDVETEAEILEFSADDFLTSLPAEFTTRIQNNGTVHIKPQGNILIKNAFGQQVANLTFNEGEFNILPNSVRRLENEWLKTKLEEDASELKKEWHNFAFGPYTAELLMTYGLGPMKSGIKVARFWVFPWQLMLFILVLLIVVVIILRFAIKRYNRWIIKKATASPPQKKEK